MNKAKTKADAGKPTVQVATDVPKGDAPKTVQRIGFMKGRIKVPDDFNEMYRAEIEEMFYGPPIEPDSSL